MDNGRSLAPLSATTEHDAINNAFRAQLLFVVSIPKGIIVESKDLSTISCVVGLSRELGKVLEVNWK